MSSRNFNEMLSEFSDLTSRLTEVRDFITDPKKFETLDYINRDLLIAQCKAMETYFSILSIRLGINGNSIEVAEEDENAPDENSVAVNE